MYNKITGDDVCYFLGYWLANTVGYTPTYYHVYCEEFLYNLEDFAYTDGISGNVLGELILNLANLEDDDYYALLENKEIIEEVLFTWLDVNLSTFWASMIKACDCKTIITFIDPHNVQRSTVVGTDILNYYDTLLCTSNNKLIWKSSYIKYFTMNTILDILSNNYGIKPIQYIVRVYYRTEIVSPAKTYPTFHMLMGMFNSLTEEEFDNLMNSYELEGFNYSEVKMMAELNLFED